jgi:hypothetical protein
MNEFGPPERVYVENEWYDGPRAGIADINGVPHRFVSFFNEVEDAYGATFRVWPVNKEIFAFELEQWCIFVAWNALRDAGQADTDSHPAHGGLNARWDELQALLKHDRSEVPAWSKRALMRFHDIDKSARYTTSGPDYMLSWRML